MAFDESQVQRNTSGQFSNKLGTTPEVDLDSYASGYHRAMDLLEKQHAHERERIAEVFVVPATKQIMARRFPNATAIDFHCGGYHEDGSAFYQIDAIWEGDVKVYDASEPDWEESLLYPERPANQPSEEDAENQRRAYEVQDELEAVWLRHRAPAGERINGFTRFVLH